MQDTFLIPMPIPKKEKQEIQDTGETSPQIMWTDYTGLRTSDYGACKGNTADCSACKLTSPQASGQNNQTCQEALLHKLVDKVSNNEPGCNNEPQT